jgi:hypothetical protein
VTALAAVDHIEHLRVDLHALVELVGREPLAVPTHQYGVSPDVWIGMLRR